MLLKRTWTDAVARWLYGIAVGGGLALVLLEPLPMAAWVAAWSAVVLALGAWLSWRRPFEARWHEAQGDVAVDTANAALIVGLVDPLLKALLPVAVVALSGPGEASWPVAGWAWGGQVAVAVLWMEFAKYWSHRAHHEWAPLWRFHAWHHSSRRLYWLNNFRLHPVNHAMQVALSLGPLLWLGVPDTVLLGALALTQPVVVLQHLNLDVHHGLWSRLFSTYELHRWHHSTEPAEANANYGSALVLWDQVFGTYRRHPAGQGPAKVGLFDASRHRRGRSEGFGWPGCCGPVT